MDAVALLRKLVSIDTNSDDARNYDRCARFLSEIASSEGFSVKIVDARKVSKDGRPRPNLIIEHNIGADETLILSTHYDIVPPGKGWRTDPFKLVIKGGRAYGRGAADDKGGIVACLSAMSRLARDEKSKVNVRLLITCDEEVGGKAGLEYLLSRRKIKGNAALVVDGGVEPTIGASGVIFGRILVKGKQAHAGYPHLGKNAIHSAIPILKDMLKYGKARERRKSFLISETGRKVWGRFSITTIRSGEKENIIPGLLEAGFDLRILPEESAGRVMDEMREFFERTRLRWQVDASLEFTRIQEGYFTSPETKIAKNLYKVLPFEPKATLGGNDGVFFANHSIPVICMGVARMDSNIHGKDEFVRLSDIELISNAIHDLCSAWE